MQMPYASGSSRDAVCNETLSACKRNPRDLNRERESFSKASEENTTVLETGDRVIFSCRSAARPCPRVSCLRGGKCHGRVNSAACRTQDAGGSSDFQRGRGSRARREGTLRKQCVWMLTHCKSAGPPPASRLTPHKRPANSGTSPFQCPLQWARSRAGTRSCSGLGDREGKAHIPGQTRDHGVITLQRADRARTG
jgi:hypothetical protein